jgi:hypothetical protein
MESSKQQKPPSPQTPPKKYPASSALPASDEELGEGNKSAAKRYNQGVKETLESKDVDKLAHQAAEALEGPEGEALREAERRAKKGPKG